jgi:hypothetical protein
MKYKHTIRLPLEKERRRATTVLYLENDSLVNRMRYQ